MDQELPTANFVKARSLIDKCANSQLASKAVSGRTGAPGVTAAGIVTQDIKGNPEPATMLTPKSV